MNEQRTATKLRQGRIAHAMRTFSPVLGTAAAFSAVINLSMLVPAIYMLQVYDRVLPSANTMTLAMLTLIMLGLYAFSGVLDYARSMAVIRIGSQLDMRLNGAVHAATFEANLKGASMQAGQTLSDLTTLRQFVTGQGLFAFFDVPWFPVYLAVIFLFDPWLGAFALAGAAILVALTWLNEKVSARPLAEAGALSIRAGALATAHLRNAEVIAAMGMLGPLYRRWQALHLRFLERQQTASEKAAAVAAFSRTVRLALQSLVLGFGALLAVEGRITAGMMIAASILMGRTLAPIEQVIAVWRQWSGARQAWERLDRLLEAHPPHAAGMPLPRPTGRLSLQGVAAVPPGTQPGQAARALFAQLSFDLEPGRVLGIAGPSGAGKSTLARLLVGAAQPAAGRVRLDGADLQQWNRGQLGEALGYLPQDVELFPGTLAENIARFGELDAEQVIEAARLAGVHELVLQMPQGYDTALGENGTGLSGGQRQRIGLARAVYGRPALVVLDEPNASLDEPGEAALLQAIAHLKKAGTTVVLIAHHGRLIEAADLLLALRPGEGVLMGPPGQVLAALGKSAPAPAAPQRRAIATASYRVPAPAPARADEGDPA